MPDRRTPPSLDTTPGAKWWRVDFHTHTPHSTDAYQGPDEVSASDWLLAHMRAGIDAVAVTDHNGGGWIDTLKECYDTLATEKPPGFRPLTIFPGVEITVADGYHLLAILDPSSSTADIQTLLGRIRFPINEQGSDKAKTQKSGAECVEELSNQNCILVPAHVNGPSGILRDKALRLPDSAGPESGEVTLQIDPRTRKAVLDNAAIFALETWRNPSAEMPDFSGHCCAGKRFSIVYGSDSHRANEVGRRTTWVRMADPTLEGLRVALLDGITSVREYIQGQPDPGPHSPYYIERIHIAGTKYIGRKQMQEIALNPSFNAIIGGRGTGKSSILELIRAATKRDSSFNNNPADYAKNFQDLIAEITGGMPKDTDDLSPLVEVDYHQHGKTFRMRWQANPPSYELLSVGEDGATEPVKDQGVWSERFPLRIFSQKQLYAFKEHTAPLLAEIDATPEVGGPAWQREWENQVAEFVQLSARIQQLAGEVKESEDLNAKMEDIQRQIEIMEKAGHKKVLRELSLRRRQGSEVERWQEQMDPLPIALEKLADQFELSAFAMSRMPAEEEGAPAPDDTYEREVEADAGIVKASLDADAASLRKMAGELKGLILEWQGRIQESRWEVARKASETTYSELIQSLQGTTQARPEQYGELVQNRQLLKKKLDGLDAKAGELEKLRQARQTEFESLEGRWSQRSERRRNFLEGLFSADANLRASLIACGDIPSGIAELRSILSREQNVAADEFECFASHLTAASDVQDRLRRIHELKIKLCSVATKGQDGGKALDIRIGKRFADHMQNRTTEDLARLLAWFPPDLLKLCYRKNDSGSFKDLEKGSPGQVAAAVLAFLLAYGDEPILLDQPEDDLDNRLIYDLIVREIQTNKLRRQLLIVTHNPNIVVNGNADLVIPIEDKNGQAAIPVMGALQNPGVRKVVCDVMEGGREALERRFRRIVP